MDGTHPTDRVQIENIEGFDRLSAPNWIVRKNPSDTTLIEIISTKTGLVTLTGTELYSLFNSLTASGEFVDGHTIIIKPTNDGSAYNAGESQANFTKDVNIFGYGAIVKGGTTAHSSGGALRQSVNNKYIKLFGLTIDSTDTTNTTKKLGTLYGGGSSTSSVTCKLCVAKDCTFNNVFNTGVNVQAKDNGTDAAPDDSTLIIDNCRFDTGTTSDSTNEHVLTNALKTVRITNCTFLGNKVGYISAQNVSVINCFSDTNGRTEGEGLGIHTENANVINCSMKGGGLTFRPFTSVHFGTNFAANKRVSIRGYTNQRVTTSYNAIEITGLDNTYTMGQCSIEDFWIGTGSVATAILNQSPTHSIIKSLVIKDGFVNAFDSNNSISNIIDHTVEYMIIQNVKTPTYPSANTPIRLSATQSTCSIDYLNIKDIFPVTDGNIVTESISSTFNATVKAAMPLQNGQNGMRSLGSGTGTRTLQFFSNRGTATFSGNGSNTTFAIPHNLASSPSFAQVSPNTSAANGSYHVTVDSTNVNAIFSPAPASGSNNVILYWQAVAS